MTIGLEEEFFIVDSRSGDLAPDGLPNFYLLCERVPSVPQGLTFDPEYQLSIVESRTGICCDLAQVRSQLELLRGAVVGVAADAGYSAVSSGTLPFVNWRTARITPKPRYDQITAHYGEVVERRVTCGCHVHIGVADRQLAVQILNRVVPWLPVLLALSASSPFFDGADTGFSSYRSVLWCGFPVACLPFGHRSYEEYQRTVQLLIDSGTMLDERSMYWDARLGVRFPTVEFRIADACTTIDDAVLQAGLCRALVLTCQREAEARAPTIEIRPELLQAARWRAARSGLEGRLVDAVAAEYLPASEVMDRFLVYVREALEDLGDRDEVSSLSEQARHRGTSARRQRQLVARTGGLSDVHRALAAETAGPHGRRSSRL